MASIIGSIVSLDCRNFNCFKKISKVNTNDEDYQQIYETAQANSILILPATNIKSLKNLFPDTNNVHNWSIMVVGRNGEYILSKLQGDLAFSGHERMVNSKYSSNMPREIRKLFDSIWDKTLLGQKILQFLMIFKGKAYLCNSYSLNNENHECIGAICFLRDAQSIEDNPRLSIDKENQMLPRDHLNALLENPTASKRKSETQLTLD